MEAFANTQICVPSFPGRDVDDVLAKVLSHEWVNGEYKHLIVTARDPAPRSLAGQFFNIQCPHTNVEKPFFRRPMSTYKADPETGTVEFLYKVTGVGTRGLATLAAGETVRILGPLGVGFTLAENWRSIVVLGRGVGLATLAPLAEMAAGRGIEVTAIISARTPAQIMSVDRFESAGAAVQIVLDSDGSSTPANVEAILRGLTLKRQADAFFTCGSNRLMLLMQSLGRELSIPGQVAMEQQMACGLGMCFCCVRNFKSEVGTVSRRVCWEGPVFDLQESLSW